MAVRSSMETLIRRLRDMVGDNGDGKPEFDGDRLQAILDNNQTRVRYEDVTPVLHFQPGGRADIHEVLSRFTDWEDGPELVDSQRNVLTALTEDLKTGRWTFTADMLTKIPIYVSGYAYDVYGAAADVCIEWASRLARRYDTGDERQKMARSQMATSLRAQAKEFRALAPMRTVRATRSDVRRQN